MQSLLGWPGALTEACGEAWALLAFGPDPFHHPRLAPTPCDTRIIPALAAWHGNTLATRDVVAHDR